MTKKTFQIVLSITGAFISAFFAFIGAGIAHSRDFGSQEDPSPVLLFLSIVWGLLWGAAVGWFTAGRIYTANCRVTGFMLKVLYSVVAGVVIGTGNDLIFSRPLLPFGAMAGASLGFIIGVIVAILGLVLKRPPVTDKDQAS